MAYLTLDDLFGMVERMFGTARHRRCPGGLMIVSMDNPDRNDLEQRVLL